MRANQLIWIIGGALMVFVLLVVVSMMSSDKVITTTQATITEPKIPEVGVDGDASEDTLKTLVARLKRMEAEGDTLRGKLNALAQETNTPGDVALVKQITRRLSQLERALAAVQKNKFLVGGAQEDKQRNGFHSAPNGVPDTLPSGFGFDAKVNTPTFHNNVAVTEDGARQISRDGYVDILPLIIGHSRQNTDVFNEAFPLNDATADVSGASLYHQFSKTQDALKQSNRGLQDEAPIEPRYTIPMNATLYEATAMTAIIGRVPVNGSVRDPFPIKIILGAENLAANGLRIPGLSGMIFAGQAVGDWNLSCVSAQIKTATYLWEDGRVQTLSDQTLSDANQGGIDDDQTSVGGESIGWISTRQGVPCVPGKRISDTGTSSGLQVLLALAEGYSTAKAAAEVTSHVTTEGTTQSGVSGNAGDYYQSIAIANAVGEVGQMIRERWKDSFDAIFIEPGRQVSVNITRTLPVDYNPNARMLVYRSQFKESRHALD